MVHPSEGILFNKTKGHAIDDCKNMKVFQLKEPDQEDYFEYELIGTWKNAEHH